jgi:hypothetical protein
MRCSCPSCRPPRWLTARDWWIVLDIALAVMLLRVLWWAWS